jgi:hypothetical protein
LSNVLRNLDTELASSYPILWNNVSDDSVTLAYVEPATQRQARLRPGFELRNQRVIEDTNLLTIQREPRCAPVFPTNESLPSSVRRLSPTFGSSGSRKERILLPPFRSVRSVIHDRLEQKTSVALTVCLRKHGLSNGGRCE